MARRLGLVLLAIPVAVMLAYALLDSAALFAGGGRKGDPSPKDIGEIERPTSLAGGDAVVKATGSEESVLKSPDGPQTEEIGPTEGVRTLVVSDDRKELMVVGGNTSRVISKLDAKGRIVIPGGSKFLYIEVGTNDQPEFTPPVTLNPNVTLVAFEPQPPIFAAMLGKYPRRARDRLMAIPAAVTPKEMLVPLHVSEVAGCSSLMSMNSEASNFASRQIKKNKQLRKAYRTQMRTIEYCAKSGSTIMVPSFPLHQLIARIPTDVEISMLMTDAQGFDIHVAATIGIENARRIPVLIVECQDLGPHDGPLWLVRGAPNCAELKSCIEKAFPHRLDVCWDNAPRVREFNCLFRNPDLPPFQLPLGMKAIGGSRPIVNKPRKDFECPVFSP